MSNNKGSICPICEHEESLFPAVVKMPISYCNDILESMDVHGEKCNHCGAILYTRESVKLAENVRKALKEIEQDKEAQRRSHPATA